jgi:hypothetical protein
VKVVPASCHRAPSDVWRCMRAVTTLLALGLLLMASPSPGLLRAGDTPLPFPPCPNHRPAAKRVRRRFPVSSRRLTCPPSRPPISRIGTTQ